MPEEKGFAISCPHCRKWNRWENESLEDKVIESLNEFKEILNDLTQASSEQNQENFFHKKLFRCRTPRWFCPASFEAFIFNERDLSIRCLNEIPGRWSVPRQFQLRQADTRTKWDNYFCILFNSQPVLRRREIELELVMDRELISRLISGICIELGLPLTCYAANVFYHRTKKEPHIYWIPIEGYSQKPQLVPPLYNCFCEASRSIALETLVKKFEENKYGVKKCPIGYGDNKTNRCGMRDDVPACERKDWNHCPAFLDERKTGDACYGSDLIFISKIEEGLTQEPCKVSDEGITDKCKAGFTEMAFPIRTHDFFVGVAMTGQVFTDVEELKDIKDFIYSRHTESAKNEPWLALRDKEEELEEAQQILIGLERLQKKQGRAKYLLNDSMIEEKKELLRRNRDRLEKVMEAHYSDFRIKVEYTFRQELLGSIENHKTDDNFFENHILFTLRRMREFWAFKAAYLIRYASNSREVSVIAKSILDQKGNKTEEAPGLNSKSKIKLELNANPNDLNPTPCLYQWGKEPDLHPSLNKIVPCVNAIIEKDKDSLNISNENYIFMVLIPSYEEVYTFVFAIRDKDAVCSLKHPNPKSLSTFCQDVILEVCSEVVYEFYNVKEFFRSHEEKMEEWRKKVEEQVKQTDESWKNTLTKMKEDVKTVIEKAGVHLSTTDEPKDKEFFETAFDEISKILNPK